MEKSLLTVFDGKVKNKQGKLVSHDELKGYPVVGIYYSADWCPPCQNFTPILAELYSQQQKKKFEIVWMSECKSPKDHEVYYEKMPWLHLPLSELNNKIKNSILRLYKIDSLPRLLLFKGNGQPIGAPGTDYVPVVRQQRKAFLTSLPVDLTSPRPGSSSMIAQSSANRDDDEIARRMKALEMREKELEKRDRDMKALEQREREMEKRERDLKEKELAIEKMKRQQQQQNSQSSSPARARPSPQQAQVQHQQQQQGRSASPARPPQLPNPQFPVELDYDYHSHTLDLYRSVYNGRFGCNVCGNAGEGMVYHCDDCYFDVCLNCARICLTGRHPPPRTPKGDKEKERERQIFQAGMGRTLDFNSDDDSDEFGGDPFFTQMRGSMGSSSFYDDDENLHQALSSYIRRGGGGGDDCNQQ